MRIGFLILVIVVTVQIWNAAMSERSPRGRGEGGVSLLQGSSSLISKGYGRKASVWVQAGQALFGWFGFTTHETAGMTPISSKGKKVRKFYDNPMKRQLELALHGSQSETPLSGDQATEWS